MTPSVEIVHAGRFDWLARVVGVAAEVAQPGAGLCTPAAAGANLL
jgi:hypothetical protein